MSERNESIVMQFYDGAGAECNKDECKVDDIMIRNRATNNRKREAATVVPEETNNIKVKTLNIDDLRRIFKDGE